MSDPTIFIEHRERLAPFFADAWPCFHDAEIITIDLWRGDVCPERDSWIGAVITMKIQVLEATQPLARHTGNDHLVTLRFHDAKDIQLSDFNHQNAIYGLTFSHESRGDGLTPYIRVVFSRGFGVEISFKCFRVEVLHAEPFSQSSHGTITPKRNRSGEDGC